MRELKNNLSRYLGQVESGTEVVVTDRGRPIARLTGMAAVGGDKRVRLEPLHVRRFECGIDCASGQAQKLFARRAGKPAGEGQCGLAWFAHQPRKSVSARSRSTRRARSASWWPSSVSDHLR